MGSTNNDPAIIAHHYINCVESLGIAPLVIRCDLGTENTTVAFLQPYLRCNGRDEYAGTKSFMYGKSTSNQRIEALWSILRKSNIAWWMNFFKDLRDEGNFCDSNIFHRECLKFCFVGIIRVRATEIPEGMELSHNYIKETCRVHQSICGLQRFYQMVKGKPKE